MNLSVKNVSLLFFFGLKLEEKEEVCKAANRYRATASSISFFAHTYKRFQFQVADLHF